MRFTCTKHEAVAPLVRGHFQSVMDGDIAEEAVVDWGAFGSPIGQVDGTDETNDNYEFGTRRGEP